VHAGKDAEALRTGHHFTRVAGTRGEEELPRADTFNLSIKTASAKMLRGTGNGEGAEIGQTGEHCDMWAVRPKS
jgi:hypothetical protein